MSSILAAIEAAGTTPAPSATRSARALEPQLGAPALPPLTKS